MAQSRTSKSLINSSVSLLFYFLGICVTIFSRRVFFDALGDQLAGLRDIIGNYLSMINLAELGIGTAIAYALYKPLHDKDTNSINEIVSLQAWFYRKIAIFVTIAAVVLLCFFPIIFRELTSPMWYAYATFIIFFWETLMSYLINYRAIIFNADQRGYRLTINMQGFYITKNILQLTLLYYFPKLGIAHPYAYYLGLEFIISLIGVYVLERMIQKDYPWLKPQVKSGRTLLKKYDEILTKIKQIFLHKLSAVALGNISPLVMYKFTSINVVSYYGSYIVLSRHISSIINRVFNSIGAGIGDLVAEGNRGKILKFFWEFGASRSLLATISAFAFYSFSSALIPVWLGDKPQYILPEVIVLMMSIIIYLDLSRFVDSYLIAYGLFQDVWAPMVEAVINVGGGFLFGYLFYENYQHLGFASPDYAGLLGVLLGVTLSVLIIVWGWKPIFLFREGFKLSSWVFWKNYIKFPLISILSITLFHYGLDYLALDFTTIPSFLFNATWTTAVFSILLFGVYYAMSQGMRDITGRFTIIIKEKLIKSIKGKFKKLT